MNFDMKMEPTIEERSDLDSIESRIPTTEFIEHVRINQQKLTAGIKPHYDFTVCASGSSSSVGARGLAENPAVSALLPEGSGCDDVPSVVNPSQWVLNKTNGAWGNVGISRTCS